MGKVHLTPEIKAEIRKENQKLSGSKNSRAIKLTKLFPYARITISKIIEVDTPTTRSTVPFAPGEREQIIRSYNEAVETIHSRKLQEVATNHQRSTNAIRRIIKQNTQPTQDRLFDHRKFYF